MADQLFYQRTQERTTRKSKEIRQRNETWLFVCEGTKTEPNYLNNLYRYLKVNFSEKLNVTFQVKGTGRNTEDLVRNTEPFFDFVEKNSRNRSIPFAKTFVVFDIDSFSHNQFNNAIFTSISKGYIPLWSNECFELWFLLHFIFLESDIGRDAYKEKLDFHFNNLVKIDYAKNDEAIFDILYSKERFKKAMDNSRRLFDDSCKTKSPSKRVPCTTMFKLFEMIEKEFGIKLY